MAQVITNGQYNYKAPRSDEGHSDGCTSLALMVRAAGTASSQGSAIIAARGESNGLSMWQKMQRLGRGIIG
jgi:hypothetical protein